MFSCALAGCADSPTDPLFAPPKVEEIIQMSHEKVAPQEIIAVIRESHAVYSLSGSQLVHLHDEGVADPVIDEVLRVQMQAARDDEWKRATARPVYWLDPSGSWTSQWGAFPYPSDPGWWRH
jgi:hypothetical protein